MPSFTESIVEDAARSWLGELEYSALHGPEIAPGEFAAERTGYLSAPRCRFRRTQAPRHRAGNLSGSTRRLEHESPKFFQTRSFQTGTGPFGTGTGVLFGNRAMARLTAALALLLPLTVGAGEIGRSSAARTATASGTKLAFCKLSPPKD